MSNAYAISMFLIGSFMTAFKERNYKALGWMISLTVPLFIILGLVWWLAH